MAASVCFGPSRRSFLRFVPLDNQQFERLNCYSSPLPFIFFSLALQTGAVNGVDSKTSSRLSKERSLTRLELCGSQVALDRQTWSRWWVLWIAIERRRLERIRKGISSVRRRGILHAAHKPVNYQMNEISCNSHLIVNRILFSITKSISLFIILTYSRGFSIAAHSTCCLISC